MKRCPFFQAGPHLFTERPGKPLQASRYAAGLLTTALTEPITGYVAGSCNWKSRTVVNELHSPWLTKFANFMPSSEWGGNTLKLLASSIPAAGLPMPK